MEDTKYLTSRFHFIFIFIPVILLIACSPRYRHYSVLDTPIRIQDNLGNFRKFRLFLPPVEKIKPPLLVYFHAVISDEFQQKVPTLKDYTGSPVEETGLIEFCRSQGIALLVPEAFYEYSFLDCLARGWIVSKETDGVEKIIDAVVSKYPTDPTRIYLAGISAGAVFCHFLANHRPDCYQAILSHSQGYMNEENHPLSPSVQGPAFGVVFAYTQGDYPQLINFINQSGEKYIAAGFRVKTLAGLPPRSHKWAGSQNSRFWKWLLRLSPSYQGKPPLPEKE